MDKNFFEQDYCERCHTDLSSRTTSWFTTETICLKCSMWEDIIIEESERSRSELEGIGTVPKVDITVEWGTNPPDF